MKNRYYIMACLLEALACMGLTSCGNDSVYDESAPGNDRMTMAFNFAHPSQTRATDTAFEKGDKVGLYVCLSTLPLEIAGNTVNNELAVFDTAGWTFSRKLYWDAGEYNAYAYYPYADNISSIADLPFSVKTDQNSPKSEGSLSGYEASDFLYGSVEKIAASSNPVDMTFRHIMSKLTIRIIKGEDYEGDIPDDAVVYIHNTTTDASIDLSAGVATKLPKASAKTITAKNVGYHSYSAIVVPQRIENRVPLIEVVMKGVSYLYDSKFVFKRGTHHLVNLVVDRNPEQVKIEIGGESVDWN